MNNIISYFFIGIALSMDAFSVSFSLSIDKLIKKKNSLILIFLIGLFHFVLPYIASLIGNIFVFRLEKYSRYILSIIFLYLAFDILFSDSNYDKKINVIKIFLLALSVSIDSFSVGLSLSISNNYSLLASLIFATLSTLFTITGLIIGRFTFKKIIKYSKFISFFIFLILALKSYFFY